MSASKKALEIVGSAKADNPVRATAKFRADFELVAKHYLLRELGEYDEARQAARNDLDAAIATYAVLAAEIREGTA